VWPGATSGKGHHRRRAQPSRHGVLCGRDQPPPAQRHRALPPKAPWWRKLSDARQQVLISIYFNLGVSGLLAFKRMLAACERGDYRRAAEEMLASKWAGSRPTGRGAFPHDAARARFPCAIRNAEPDRTHADGGRPLSRRQSSPGGFPLSWLPRRFPSSYFLARSLYRVRLHQACHLSFLR
jgi:hypothetical protein